jgi:DNA-binding NarL/FixJ family response regulator
MAIRIVIVDDHRLFREGLRALLRMESDLQVLEEAGDAVEAVTLAEKLRPDVILMDLALPGASGISATREIMRRNPAMRVLLLSMMLDEEHVAQALEAGAVGYVAKEQAAQEVFQAIRVVAAGKRYLSPLIPPSVLEEYMRQRARGEPGQTPLRSLTNREREIFDLAVRGHSNESIAQNLTISRRTVETHRGRILRKLGAHSAADLVRIAARHGLLAP